MTSIQLHHGDAAKTLARLEGQIPPVAACICSPPYWGRRAYSDDPGEIGRDQTIAAYVDDLTAVFAGVWRLLRDDGILWLNLGDTAAGSGGSGGDYYNDTGAYHDRAKYRQGKPILADGTRVQRGQWCMIPERTVIALQATGWHVRSKVVWRKPKTRRASKAHERRPGEQHELIYMLTKRTGQKVRYFWEREIEPGDVWDMGTASGAGLGKAPFPVELPRRCIDVSSEPGDTILDPFMGSGATLVAAAEQGRHAVGIDLDREAIDLTIARLNSLPNRQQLAVSARYDDD